MFWRASFSIFMILVCVAALIKCFYDTVILMHEMFDIEMLTGIVASVVIFGFLGFVEYWLIQVILDFAKQYPELF